MINDLYSNEFKITTTNQIHRTFSVQQIHVITDTILQNSEESKRISVLETQNSKLFEEVEKLKVFCEENRVNNKETYDKLFFGINNQSLHQT